MSGNNVLYGAGMLECGMVVDYSQLLLDSDIIDMIKYFLGGVEVSDDTLCVDEIRQEGHKSNFLMSPMTLKYMRTQSRPKFFERMNRSTWENAGKPDPYDLAREKVKDILVNHQPTPLSDSVASDLRRFVAEVEKEWGIEPKNPDFDPASLVRDKI
jgi:trimethylamine---corrinoid protein Co-methyltransferase